MVGQTLGHYTILEKLGAGGMGEVYRAEDSVLGREVALKVLPDAFTHDPERLARFEREAKLLASLNHPHIAQIHALENIEDQRLLVMELVDGQTIADLISERALPVEEALPIALQITQALEAAHEKGIVHRDLKPANIKLTPEGEVKVLDFGLAKPVMEAGSGDLSHSPTLTYSPTQAGVLLGTAAYMSPEQARGQEVDKRTDIWAFGCVFYEMLSGEQPFAAETVSDCLVRILEKEPDWDALPKAAPAAVRKLLRHCLAKDLRRRLHDIGDALLELDEAIHEPATSRVVPEYRPQIKWLIPVQWGLIAVLVFVTVLMVWFPWRAAPPEATYRVAVPTEPLSLTYPGLEISPDGQRIVYVTEVDGVRQLYLRELKKSAAEPLPGTENALMPFFSPSGGSVGFFADGKLKRISLLGGPPDIISDAAGAGSSGGAWGANDTIVFAVRGEGLKTVPAVGGTPQGLTSLDMEKSEWIAAGPRFLPGGKSVIFSVYDASCGILRIAAKSLKTGQEQTLVEGAHSPLYANSGHLLYVKDNLLRAAPFDVDALELEGPAVTVGEGILRRHCSSAALSLSEDGSLAYLTGEGLDTTLVWVDRQGRVEPITQEVGDFIGPRISPDGRKIAFWIGGRAAQVYLYDLVRGSLAPLTSEGSSYWPVWTPDGDRIIFPHLPGPAANLFWKRADGGGPIERLTESEYHQQPLSFSPGGKVLAFHQSLHPTTGWDVWILQMENKKSKPLLQTAADELWPAFSPDGDWLAYTSDESGQEEIWVTEYPGPGRKAMISIGGGTEPVWSPSGAELFYRDGSRMMAVSVVREPTLSVGRPEVLFEANFRQMAYGRNYDVFHDGQRFIMPRSPASLEQQTRIWLVLNWFEELERSAPTSAH